MHSSRVRPVAVGVVVVALVGTAFLLGPLGGSPAGPNDAAPRAGDQTAVSPTDAADTPGDAAGRDTSVGVTTDAPTETTTPTATGSPDPTATDGYAVDLQNGSAYDRGLTLVGEGPADATVQVRRVSETGGDGLLTEVVATDERGRYRLDTTNFEPGTYRVLTDDGDTVAAFEVRAIATATATSG
jgi:hypothetical protein